MGSRPSKDDETVTHTSAPPLSSPTSDSGLPVDLIGPAPDDAASATSAAAPDEFPDTETAEEPRYDIDDHEVYEVIYRCERQATGHGVDSDRALLLVAAQWLRTFMGLSPNDVLPYPAAPAPFGPVTPAPPIGHSLPGDSQK